MSILDIDQEDVKITKDDLIKDGWSPDRLGRVWTKRIQIKRIDDDEKEFAAYVFLRYTRRDPHKKQKHILYATGGLYENTFKDIKSMLDINACIGSIARTYVGDKPYHILNANFNKFYATWQDYIDAELNR